MNTIDLAEIQNFSKDSSQWWDENGPFKPLHRLHPVRMGYIKDQICRHFSKNPLTLNSLKGLDILDIGCGGGLVCESLARLQATVTGIDADQQAIDVATDHATQSGLRDCITYHCHSTEDLLTASKQYDVVLALEIIEHVSSPSLFVKDALSLCKPGGCVIFSTLNRTPHSYALAIIAAEYIVRWVPRGTHHWKKFVKPSELARMVRNNNAVPHNTNGLVYSPIKNEFRLDAHDMRVNYFLTATRP